MKIFKSELEHIEQERRVPAWLLLLCGGLLVAAARAGWNRAEVTPQVPIGEVAASGGDSGDEPKLATPAGEALEPRLEPPTEARPPLPTAPPLAPPTRRVDLGTATISELRGLPGIGPRRAVEFSRMRWEREGRNFPPQDVHGIGARTARRVRQATVWPPAPQGPPP